MKVLQGVYFLKCFFQVTPSLKIALQGVLFSKAFLEITPSLRVRREGFLVLSLDS